MRTSQYGLNLIRLSESFSSKPYLCPAGVPTIGFGTTVYPNGRKVSMKDAPITKEYALEILANEVDHVYEEYIDKHIKVPLTQGQYDALVDFVYNLGVGSLLSSTLIKKINAKDYKGAYFEFDKWVMARDPRTKKKIRLAGLQKRRDAEQALWLSNTQPVKDE